MQGTDYQDYELSGYHLLTSQLSQYLRQIQIIYCAKRLGLFYDDFLREIEYF